MRFYDALTAPRSLANTFQKGASWVVAKLIRMRGLISCYRLNWPSAPMMDKSTNSRPV